MTLAETDLPSFLSESVDRLGLQNEKTCPEGGGGQPPALSMLPLAFNSLNSLSQFSILSLNSLSLFLSFLFPASWNADVMGRSPAATLGNEDEGNILV